MKQRPEGVCHICGETGLLSNEHVPPQSAYNDHTMTRLNFKQFTDTLYGRNAQPLIQQGGASDFTLCDKCNNNTGSWYGGRFVKWTRQGMEALRKADQGREWITFHPTIHPLSILKQIICMFLSINRLSFRSEHPELPNFVLHKINNDLPPQYRVFTYFLACSAFRRAGKTGILPLDPNTLRPGKMTWATEISHPPFGYLMTIESGPPDDRLCEITQFTRYRYDERRDLELKLPVLPTHFPVLGDYRSADEIKKDLRRGVEAEQDETDSQRM